MSQFFVNTSSSSPVIPVNVATSYPTDSGTAIPAANILNVYANDTNVNNDNGIQTIGSGNTVTVQLTNRLTGLTTTTDATATTIISVSLGAVAGVYYMSGDLVAYDVTDAAGSAYSFSGAAVTDGTNATEIATETKDIFEQLPMENSDFSLIVDSITNTASLQVTGIAATTINWSALLTYRFVGV